MELLLLQKLLFLETFFLTGNICLAITEKFLVNIINCLCVFIRYSFGTVSRQLSLLVFLFSQLLNLALNELTLFLLLVCLQSTLSSMGVHLSFKVALVVSLKLSFSFFFLLLFVLEADHIISYHQFPRIHIAIIWFVKALNCWWSKNVFCGNWRRRRNVRIGSIEWFIVNTFLCCYKYLFDINCLRWGRSYSNCLLLLVKFIESPWCWNLWEPIIFRWWLCSHNRRCFLVSSH